MHRRTVTRVRRSFAHRAGGHLYQGRSKSFPVEIGEHLLAVCRYVERNALRADLAMRAEDWRRGSLWRRCHILSDDLLSEWPIAVPAGWVDWVNEPQTARELEALRISVTRGRPFASAKWVDEIASALKIDFTLRPRGRPRKDDDAEPARTCDEEIDLRPFDHLPFDHPL